MPQTAARWFTDQVLAPRADWYRPDLATHRVRQVTRTTERLTSEPVVGNRHHATRPGQAVQEVLTYDGQGYLLRYHYAVHASNPGAPTQGLGNRFSYDAQHRLRQVQLTGTTALLPVPDVFSSKAYARWRKPDPAFRRRHNLPAYPTLQELFPETWQLHSITWDHPAAGPAPLPRAVVAFTATTATAPARRVAWTDTVLLDPRRDWHLATPDTLAGYADTTWLHQPTKWWQPQVATTPVPGLRLQHVPPNSTQYGRSSPYYDYSSYNTVEATYGVTSFFNMAGQLQLARMPGDGTVWRYHYDAQGQPQRVEAYFLHLPHRYGDTLYFGGVRPVYPIPDCEHRQREALTLVDGQQGVRELLWVQQVRYEQLKQYAVDVSFNESLSPVRPAGHDGPFVKVKDWRQVEAQLERQSQLRARGCVPMKLTTTDTQVLHVHYEFFP